jgi:hypothetical protein
VAAIINDQKPSIEERVGKALSRGDLRQNDLAPCDLDKVAALGAVGIEEKLADAVFRLKYANDVAGYDEALAGVIGLARVLDVKLKWRARRSRHGFRRMATRVLHYWLAPNCTICTGVGYQIINGSPHLSDRACPACHGERVRPMPWMQVRLPHEPGDTGRDRKSRERWARWQRKCQRIVRLQQCHRELLIALEVAERRIGDKMIWKLAGSARNL